MKSADLNNPIYDISKEYDIYYEGGKDSIYNKRFGQDKVIYHEKYIIKKCLKNIVKYLNKVRTNVPKIVKVLDFGCGDGRLFEFLESQAKFYDKQNFVFEITALDISLTGLNEYISKLELLNYRFLEKKNIDGSNECYLYASMYLNNVKVNFIHTNENSKIENIKYLEKQKFHLNLCIFSVLSHISSRERRLEILNSFNKVAENKGKSIITVPGKKMFYKEFKTFKHLRELIRNSENFMGANPILRDVKQLVEHVKNDGDLIYWRKSKNRFLLNFCHLFDINSFQEELKLSNFDNGNVGILSTIYVPVLTRKNFLISSFDFIISKMLSAKILPSFLVDNLYDQLYYVNTH